jgi:transcriptional regulator with XRE-family HTH domain
MKMQSILDVPVSTELCQFGNVMEKQARKPTNQIKFYREKAGLTQSELAERIGTTAATISRLEVGSRELRDHYVQSISRVLGVTPQALRGYTQSSDEGSLPRNDTAVERAGEYLGIPKDIPILGEPSGAAEGVFLSPDAPKINGYTYRPGTVTGHNAFAFQVNGKTMYPRYWNNEIVVCITDRKPRLDEYVAIIDQHNIAVVRLLTLIDDEKVTVRSHQPERENQIAISDIKAMYPLAGWGF